MAAAVAAATPVATKKWVGFDMDECLAQLGILYYFLIGIPEDVLGSVVEGLAEKEKTGETWILRPAFRELLPLLVDAHKSGALTGVFIYSNNGSQQMVDFVGDLVNAIVDHTLIDKRFSAKWPEERKGPALSKNLEFLQKYLSTDVTKENLLFFDDLPDHTLAEQLSTAGLNKNAQPVSNYIKVTPYKNQLDYAFLTQLFDEFIAAFPEQFEAWNLLERAERSEKRDVEAGKLLEPPDLRRARSEQIFFRSIFHRFLGLPTTMALKMTRKAARKIATKSRKCRRRRQSHSLIQ